MNKVKDVRFHASPLAGFEALFAVDVSFNQLCFDVAMDNILRNPNINSTVLLRADILIEYNNGTALYSRQQDLLDESWKTCNIKDTNVKSISLGDQYYLSSYIVRRLVPRNPSRDAIVNQSCLVYTNKEKTERVVVYTPHCTKDEVPFYLPAAQAVALMFSPGQCSVHYRLFEGPPLHMRNPSDRLVRIGLHLLEKCVKHSLGKQNGYIKRVTHDRVVGRVEFQNSYILLKQKYAAHLLENWVENTNPRKHVFEDLGIAAFLMCLWKHTYPSKDFDFVDLGCGNGLLVYILISEGYRGRGIDARARKSWKTYPDEVQRCLEEKFIVPTLLKLDSSIPKDRLTFVGPDLDGDAFYIGNHSDELTLWLPLLGHKFMAIPCCSHALSGKPARFSSKGEPQQSAYAGLVAKVQSLATRVGWVPEVEALRIPSTRNYAIVGREISGGVLPEDVLAEEGGAQGWLESVRPRDH